MLSITDVISCARKMTCLSTWCLFHNNFGILLCAESDPVCHTNTFVKDGSVKEFEYTVFRCEMNLSGQYVPSMQWSVGDIHVNETFSVINSNTSHFMQHLASVAILQASTEKNGIMITCKIQFNETPMKVHYTNATNIPDYFFRWNTTLNVHCKCGFLVSNWTLIWNDYLLKVILTMNTD